jgi:hypothetical protein
VLIHKYKKDRENKRLCGPELRAWKSNTERTRKLWGLEAGTTDAPPGVGIIDCCEKSRF